MGDDRLRLVIFGASNVISDLFDCALANDLIPSRVGVDLPRYMPAHAIPGDAVWTQCADHDRKQSSFSSVLGPVPSAPPLR